MEQISDSVLLSQLEAAQNAVEEAVHHKGLLEMEIMRRMRERNAIGIPSDVFTCELKQANTYDQGRFTPLLELLSGDELEKVFTPEHQETVTVAERWNTVGLLAVARRYGGEVLRLVQEAKVAGAPRLSFKRK